MAGNFSKWGFHEKEDGALRVVLFISRNKDNKDIEDFKERRETFVTHRSYDDETLKRKFEAFVAGGQDGEVCRMYMSVNARNEKKVRKALLHELIDKEDFSLSNIEALVASIAARKENALEKKWMFDFDYDDIGYLEEFCNAIHGIDAEVKTESHKTPHGYAVITNRGFDTRELAKKWSDATLKRDDLLCVAWQTKTE